MLNAIYGPDYKTILPNKYINFKNDSQADTTVFTKQNLIRVTLFLGCFETVFMAVYLFAWSSLYRFFTNWTSEATSILILLTIKCSNDKNFANKPGLLAFLHILFEITMTMNFVVVTMYWTLIHSKEIVKVQGETMKIIHMWLVHILPALAWIINFYLTDVKLNPSHWKMLIPIGMVYSSVNAY